MRQWVQSSLQRDWVSGPVPGFNTPRVGIIRVQLTVAAVIRFSRFGTLELEGSIYTVPSQERVEHSRDNFEEHVGAKRLLESCPLCGRAGTATARVVTEIATGPSSCSGGM